MKDKQISLFDNPINSNVQEEEFKKGDDVIITDTDGTQILGQVWSSYNGGNTINILLPNNSIQPWFKKNVRKVK